jgi:hypothetical protein
MPKFILEINLGNDAMQTPRDVAEVLDRAAYTLRSDGCFTGDFPGTCDASARNIRDRNGNTVGHYEVLE